jgi:hypothetical protein
MRDIRGDLQDRANLVAEQIKSVQRQFDDHIEKIKVEHETKLEDLRSALHKVQMVIGIEKRRFGSVAMVELQPAPVIQVQIPEAEPQKPLPVMRKVVGRR